MAKSAAAKKPKKSQEPEKAGPAPTAASRTGDTVTVACSLPMGMTLHLVREVNVDMPVMGGGTRTVKEYHRIPDDEIAPVTLYGVSVPYGQRPRCLIVGGYALTNGVPADFARKWFEQNKNLDAVKNNQIFIQKDEAAAKSATKEFKGDWNGMQPLDMSMTKTKDGRDVPTDKRIPKPLRSGVGSLHTAPESQQPGAHRDEG